MLDQFATQTVVFALNRLLEREVWARDKLAPYAGRSARIEAGLLAVALAVDASGRFTSSSTDSSTGTNPDVTIAFDSAQFPGLFMQLLDEPQAALRNVRLSGDADFAQVLSQVLQNLRPEPEEELSRWVGDAAAVRIVSLLRTAFAQAKDGGERLARTTADYFVAEDPLLVSRSQAAEFFAHVVTLRDAVERLGKRIERLERKRAPAGGAGEH
jgi:ubiquinone biosynthesis protein UbiJ